MEKKKQTSVKRKWGNTVVQLSENSSKLSKMLFDEKGREPTNGVFFYRLPFGKNKKKKKNKFWGPHEQNNLNNKTID